MMSKGKPENNKREKDLVLDVLSKDWDRTLEELSKGNIVVIRSKNDFLYVIQMEKEYHLFSHTPGSPGGGRKSFPRDEKHTAIIRGFLQVSDSVFMVEYKKDLDIYGVLASAEEGILSMYPGSDRDADEMVEFLVPKKNNENEEVS